LAQSLNSETWNFIIGLILLSQSVAAFTEKNHIFEKTHLFSMRRG